MFITLVLDVDTGLVFAASTGDSPSNATHEAFVTSLSAAPPPLSSGPPARVLCAGEHLDLVRSELLELVEANPSQVEEIIPGAEAEGIFDMLIEHLAGNPAAR